MTYVLDEAILTRWVAKAPAPRFGARSLREDARTLVEGKSGKEAE